MNQIQYDIKKLESGNFDITIKDIPDSTLTIITDFLLSTNENRKNLFNKKWSKWCKEHSIHIPFVKTKWRNRFFNHLEEYNGCIKDDYVIAEASALALIPQTKIIKYDYSGKNNVKTVVTPVTTVSVYINDVDIFLKNKNKFVIEFMNKFKGDIVVHELISKIEYVKDKKMILVYSRITHHE